MQVKSEDTPPYVASESVDENAIIAQALEILQRRIFDGPVASNPSTVKNYLQLRAASFRDKSVEVFSVMYLTAKHQVIWVDDCATGTLSSCTVHPREIVKSVIKHGAAAVILSHNHPSGNPKPSAADHALTTRIRDALSLIDVTVVDHIITTQDATYSFAENGQM